MLLWIVRPHASEPTCYWCLNRHQLEPCAECKKPVCPSHRVSAMMQKGFECAEGCDVCAQEDIARETRERGKRKHLLELVVAYLLGAVTGVLLYYTAKELGWHLMK